MRRTEYGFTQMTEYFKTAESAIVFLGDRLHMQSAYVHAIVGVGVHDIVVKRDESHVCMSISEGGKVRIMLEGDIKFLDSMFEWFSVEVRKMLNTLTYQGGIGHDV